MDGADLLGILVIGLVITAGLASFALAGLAGGAVASVVARRGPSPFITWSLVPTAGFGAGVVTLVGLTVLWDVLEPVIGDLPLLYPAWAVSALAGVVTRVALSGRWWSRQPMISP